MKGNKLMNDVLNEIVELLTKAGKVRKPKSEGAKGLLVFNPINLDYARIELLASQVEGLECVNTTETTFFNNKPVPPHIWIGPGKAGVSIDEGVSALASDLGM